MRILLVDPGSKKLLFNENFPHIGLAYVAAALEDRGHEVTCLDVGLVGNERTDMLLQDMYDVVGLSVTSFTVRQAYDIAGNIKMANKNTVIVLGGPHISIGMGQSLESRHVDYAIYGEGEETMVELMEAIQKPAGDQPADFYAIKGLIFRDKEKVHCNPQRPRIEDLDKLAYPAFHLFEIDQYSAYPLFTSRGCPFGCSFCSIKAIWGTLWRYRSAQNIIEEIEYARRRFNWNNKPFNIIDDSFNVIPERVMEFCRQLISRKLNIQWFSSGFRADRVPIDLALEMKKSGCIGVSVGVETVNEKVLEGLHKKTTVSEITEGCRNLAQAGIPVQAQFMIGNPGDTPKTIRESIEYAQKQSFATVAFYLALPYPKTELWDYVKQNGRFLQEDYTEFHHFSDIPVFETPEFTAQERIAAYRVGRRLALRTKIKHEVRTKLARIKRFDFQDIDAKRVAKAIARLGKYSMDIVFNKKEEV
jgi:anaerobic magnesium-protoporphyrin IX monomethyl ester cyclase